MAIENTTEILAAANIGLAWLLLLGGKGRADALRINFSAQNPALRQALKR